MAFKIPKNTLICLGILIAVLVGLWAAKLFKNEYLPSFLQRDDFKNEGKNESNDDDDNDEEEDDDEDWKNITEEDLLELA